MKALSFSVLLEWSFFLLLCCSLRVTNGNSVWSVLSPAATGEVEDRLNVRVDSAPLSDVLLNARESSNWPIKVAFPGIWELLRGNDDGDDEDEEDENPNGRRRARFNNRNPVLDCELGPSNLAHPQLAEEFPQIFTLAGTCELGARATLVYNTQQEGSLSVSFYPSQDVGNPIFSFRESVESQDPSIDSNEYRLVRWRDLDFSERANIEFLEPPETPPDPDDQGRRELQDLTYSTITTYQIAVATTIEFGTTITGSTSATTVDVHTEVLAIMARVNAIYMREMAVYFQLVPDNQLLYCVDSTADCASWINDDAFAALNFVDDYITSVGSYTYDLSHLFQATPPPSSGSRGSGIAYTPSICNSGNFTNGVSGWSSQGGLQGALFLGILVHELGHQLGATHTYRDCRAVTGQFSDTSSVEPGSGTTIMSYSGICGDTNTGREDYWFHSKSLEQMRTTVDSRSCGSDTGFTTSQSQPVPLTQLSCTVPRGNFVQLDGSVAGDTSGLYYAWDRVDVDSNNGEEDYLDPDVPRFIAQQPTTRSSARYLPNLYLLSYDLVDSQNVAGGRGYEIEPKDGGGDLTMTFRFIARTRFNTDPLLEESSFDASMAGIWGYTDMTLTFDDGIAPLDITSPTLPLTLTGGDMVTIEWTGGIPGDQVQFFIALNTMEDDGLSYNYNEDVDFLSFVPMDGAFDVAVQTANVMIPNLGNPSSLDAVIMARSFESDECFYFDLLGDITYSEGTGSEEPSTSPTVSTRPSIAPSGFPSNEPTDVPSASPSVSPTASSQPSVVPSSQPTISQWPSITPTGVPTAGPSQEPTGVPSAPPSVSPTASSQPSVNPTNQLTISQGPSITPTDVPTAGPSQEPTDFPSTNPSVSPTVSSQPSVSPTSQPSTSQWPSIAPSDAPTPIRSQEPTEALSATPSVSPTTSLQPSGFPTSQPTTSQRPSLTPTDAPSPTASREPTVSPSLSPSASPTTSLQPSVFPTSQPTLSRQPSDTPTDVPTTTPSHEPTTSPLPSLSPTDSPSSSTHPSQSPTQRPTVSLVPSNSPTLSARPSGDSQRPSEVPTISSQPSYAPTSAPSTTPSENPSANPTVSSRPSEVPTSAPSATPSIAPSASPKPSDTPSNSPSTTPSGQPTVSPSTGPSQSPSAVPSAPPTVSPSSLPSISASGNPSSSPSLSPSGNPSAVPSDSPTDTPSYTPTGTPSAIPSTSPSEFPTVSSAPTESPSDSPTELPTTSASVSPTFIPTISVAPSIPPTTGDQCLNPPVLCPVITASSSKKSKGKLNRRDLRFKLSTSSKSSKSQTGPEEPAALFPICVARRDGKTEGRHRRTRKIGKGKGKGGHDADVVVYETQCIDLATYEQIVAPSEFPTTSPGKSSKGKGGKGKSSSGSLSLQDFTCGCCGADLEDDVPEFCFGPPVCADNPVPCSPYGRRLRWTAFELNGGKSSSSSKGSGGRFRGGGKSDDESRGFVTVCVGGTTTLCVDEYDEDYLDGTADYTCGAC